MLPYETNACLIRGVEDVAPYSFVNIADDH